MGEIIVGVDGSDNSRRALAWAMREAAIRHAQLKVMAVREFPVEPIARVYWPLPYVPVGRIDGGKFTRTALQELIDKVASDLGAETSGILLEVTQGDPAHELLREAQEADLLVVGSRGSGGFARLMMGSVTTKITHHSTCPVAVIPARHE